MWLVTIFCDLILVGQDSIKIRIASNYLKAERLSQLIYAIGFYLLDFKRNPIIGS